jgi:flagellar hook-basal body protein
VNKSSSRKVAERLCKGALVAWSFCPLHACSSAPIPSFEESQPSDVLRANGAKNVANSQLSATAAPTAGPITKGATSASIGTGTASPRPDSDAGVSDAGERTSPTDAAAGFPEPGEPSSDGGHADAEATGSTAVAARQDAEVLHDASEGGSHTAGADSDGAAVARYDAASPNDGTYDAFGLQLFAQAICPSAFLEDAHYAEGNEFWLGEQTETTWGVTGLGYFASQGSDLLAATFSYSRTLALSVRPDGTLEDHGGNPVLGYGPDPLADDCLTTLLAPIATPSKATTQLELVVNLDSQSSEPPVPFDATNPAQSAVAPPFSVPCVDPAGQRHSLAVYFEHVSSGYFRYHVLAPNNDLYPGETGFTERGVGALQFDAAGALLVEESPLFCVAFWGASEQCLTLDFGKSIADDGATGFEGSTSTEAVTAMTKVVNDGYAAGTSTKLSVDAQGVVNVSFDNGQVRAIGTLALARFPNEAELERAEGSAFRQTPGSGEPAFGPPTSPGRGSVTR